MTKETDEPTSPATSIDLSCAEPSEIWESDIASPSFRADEDCSKRERTSVLLIGGQRYYSAFIK